MRAVLLAFAVSLLAQPAVSETLSGRAKVHDGDTLSVGGERVRLFGIDAPELDQLCERRNAGRWDCGRWSRDQLADLVAGRNVRCEGSDRDRYGRLLARCGAGGRDLGEQMVRIGAAEAYRRYSTAYVDAEKKALLEGAGLWQGRLQAPEDYRAAGRQVLAAESTDVAGCAIKGNISSSGRIYHLPGQEDYEATRINPSRGERWFCSEAEAVAAGWRRARR